jgi:dihydropteroate synthase
VITRGAAPLVMGILNVTPDSFSDGGRWLDIDAAVAHGVAMAAAGAAVIDVGGESTRPGASPVDEDTELARVIPVIERLGAALAVSYPDVRLSIDTTKAAVARAAVGAGVSLLNDVSASLSDIAGELGVGWVAMHSVGPAAATAPAMAPTMAPAPHYDDVVAEVVEYLAAAAAQGRAAGVSEIWLDPGLGFAKTTAHNLALVAHLDALADLGYPVVLGASRKRFLGELLGRSDGVDGLAVVDDRREGSLAVATWAMALGVEMVRVHDVQMTAQAVSVLVA